jgi:hypothetical protein
MLYVCNSFYQTESFHTTYNLEDHFIEQGT